MNTIFIYDDVRSISDAVNWRRSLVDSDRAVISLVRPFRHNGDSIVADHNNAFDVITSNDRFTSWILDNDLAPGLEGLDFLKMAIEDFPDKLPDRVFSCSANFDRRQQIESYFSDWKRVHRGG